MEISSARPVHGAGASLQPRERSFLENAVGAGVPGLLSAGMAYTSVAAVKAMMPKANVNPIMFAAVAGAMGAWQGLRNLDKVAQDPAVTHPADTGRGRGEAIRDGAIVGAATLGLTVAGLIGVRAGAGAALAGGGPVRIATEVVRKALPWAAAAGVAGAGLGAGFGATLREPDAAIENVRDRTLGSARTSALWGGGIGLVGGAAIAGMLSRNAGKAAVAGGVGAAAGALMLGTSMLGYNFINNTASTWANSPKR